MAAIVLMLLRVILVLVGYTFAAENGSTTRYCELVDSLIPGSVSYADNPVYRESLSSYYSGQESDLRPGCIFSPKSASEVSLFVKTVTSKQDCSISPQFAVRSGGHTIWSGAANIDGGITVDLRAMNTLELSEDKTVAYVGVGGIWSEIYAQLVPYNLTIMGGRVAGIGVGGLATGGGIHYLSRRNGWVCDNVYNYEVVLASGEIVQASAGSYSDLRLALKGGSNNFGIITRIDVPTWPQGLMWGGSRSLSDFMKPENFDDAADMGMALIFQNPGNVYAIGNSLYYVEAVENPAVYQPFISIPGQVGRQLVFANASTFPIQAGGTLPPDTRRAIDIVYSFKNGGPDIYSSIFESWENGTKVLAAIEGLQLVLLMQPHPVTNGTNSLGLPPSEKDIVLTVITAAYAHREDDEMVQHEMQSIIDSHVSLLKRHGLYIPFEYLNYADKSQDPIGSYGEEVKCRLQDASRKYDPDGVFQTQVPGGFKLFN
ncbi:uncharacterized protein JN550_006825 [Neoarthrinium moseri]|uniref:uncharacterized protein n=1 Tax=Neoarthrinium moseri TaxID=1658444 RepID=UPI001FDDB728|nr:uncharacterized protein JN550_006825 [Neoarthrinium moseri]KAI1867684.1 hypothetical protein JN550_006825 [Neoarthrinium moseri]